MHDRHLPPPPPPSLSFSFLLLPPAASVFSFRFAREAKGGGLSQSLRQ